MGTQAEIATAARAISGSCLECCGLVMPPAATCTDGAARPIAPSISPPQSHRAAVPPFDGTVCPCPVSREGDPPGCSSYIPAGFGADAARLTQSRDPGSLRQLPIHRSADPFCQG